MLQSLLSAVDELKTHREKLLQACHQAMFAETPDNRQLAVNTAHHHREKIQATFTSLANAAHLVSDFMRSPAPAGDDHLLASVEGLIALTERKSSKMGAGSGAYYYGTAMPGAETPRPSRLPGE